MPLLKSTENLIRRCAACTKAYAPTTRARKRQTETAALCPVTPRLMCAILACPHVHKQNCVIFTGGFMDTLFQSMLKLTANYALLNPGQDVWYASHASGKQISDIVKSYNQAGKKVVLVGHSWGGDTVAWLLAKEAALRADLLLTLDPVSRKGPPSKSANMGRWVNVFLDFSVASLFQRSNLLARLGSPWGRVPAANVNVIQDEWSRTDDHNGSQKSEKPHHSDVRRMLLCHTVTTFWKEILPDSTFPSNPHLAPNQGENNGNF